MCIYATSDWAWLSPHTHALPIGLGTCDCVCPPGVSSRRSREPDTHRQLWPQPQLFVSAQEGSWSSSGVPLLWGVSGVIPVAHCLARRPFSGAPVESPAGLRNHNKPFPVPVLVPAPGPPQTMLCPHQNYLHPHPQLPLQGVFNLPLRTACLPLLPPWLAFQSILLWVPGTQCHSLF